MLQRRREEDRRADPSGNDRLLSVRHSSAREGPAVIGQTMRGVRDKTMINCNYVTRIIKLGAALTLLAALSAFAVRAAEAQVVTPPASATPAQPQPGAVQRLSLGQAARLAA